MLGENNNIKDSEKNSQKDTLSIPAPYEAEGFRSGSYTKTNKLISALYMVTDVLDKDEPIRSKLRTLGTEIISDIHIGPENALFKIGQIMSFLGIASDVNIISEMNCNILRKEFLELDQSIRVSENRHKTFNKINLSEFFKEPEMRADNILPPIGNKYKGQSIGHIKSNSIGVQKGHTLMQALNRMEVSNRANSSKARPNMLGLALHTQDFNLLKKERRDEIINIIKTNINGVTITDIKTQAKGLPAGHAGVLVSCGEKTLQRELISMVKNGVLKKVGEKRWSKYFIK